MQFFLSRNRVFANFEEFWRYYMVFFLISGLFLNGWASEGKCDFESVVTEIVHEVTPYIKKLSKPVDVYRTRRFSIL